MTSITSFFVSGFIVGVIIFYVFKKTQIPHWNKAPHWAKYLAQDYSGQWYWYNNEPVKITETKSWSCISQTSTCTTCTRAHKGFKNVNWEDTLKKRPDEK